MEMGKPIIGVLLILSFLFVAAHAVDDDSYSSCPNGYDCRPYPPPPRRLVYKLRFFVQIFSRGECQSVYEVARANIPCRSRTDFGTSYVTDSLITAGPDIDSPRLGRMQGTLASADRTTPSLVRLLVFLFDSKPYNGSTFTAVDRIPIAAPNVVTEVPIIAGTGSFRNAKGQGTRRVYSVNPVTGYTVVEYDVVLYTYEDDRYE